MAVDTLPVRFRPAHDSPSQSAFTVGIVMPVGRDTPAFHRALAALQQAWPAPDQVVVVCDGRVDGAARAAREAGCLVIELAERRGPAAARNAGTRALVTEIVLFVDADVAIHPGLIGAVRTALADPAISAIVGCYDATAPAPNFFSQYKNLLQRFVHLDAREAGSTFWGACGAVRRLALLAVGGFDERFTSPSVEDIDLGYRLKAAGFAIRFDAALEVTHLKRWTLGSLVRSDVLRRALPWTWLLIRERRIEPDLNLRYASRAAGLLAWVLAVSVAMSWTNARALAPAALAAMALVLIDHRLYRFFRDARGAGFAARAVAWHWIYYLYGTLTFAAGLFMYPIIGKRLVRTEPAPVAADGAGRRDVA
jgi:GT2 family glycosyltransferase